MIRTAALALADNHANHHSHSIVPRQKVGLALREFGGKA